MTANSARRSGGGFTLAETLIGVTILTAVAIACYSMLLNSTLLFAKNVSVNTSGTVLRTALDRMYSDASQAYGIPKLINVDGSPVIDPAPAGGVAGFTFDLYLGGPYVVTNPGTTGLAASAQSFSMKGRADSNDPLTLQPVPVANDVVVLDNAVTRPVVNTCTSSTSSNIRTVTVNLKAPLGSVVSWNATTTKTAFLVHKKAYIVAPVNGYGELRMYNDAEAVVDYSNPDNYVVLSRELSGVTNENTPFSLVTQNGNKFLKIAMRVEGQKFNKALALKQAKEFNTFLQLDTMLRPRN